MSRHFCCRLVLGFLVALSCCVAARAEDSLPVVTEIEWQPLAAQVRRVVQALELVGAPLDDQQQADLQAALEETDPAEAVAAVQSVLDPLCLVGVNINPESRVKVAVGPAPIGEVLHQGGAGERLQALQPATLGRIAVGGNDVVCPVSPRSSSRGRRRSPGS